MDTSSYLSPRQLATRWAFHAESVRRLVRAGRVPSIKLGSRVRIPLVAIEQIENESLRSRGVSR